MSEENKNELAEEELEVTEAEETQEVSQEEPSEEEKLRKELEDSRDMYLRTVAEYDNFRKRTAKEKIEIYGDATMKAVSEILSVIDNFERALAVETPDENFKKGIQMIFNQYLEILKKLGVSEIQAEGAQFNPEFHHAVQQIENEELGENVVATVFQKGYMLGDKVIRPSMVVVANP
ncbi:MAG: nucleotide exchange factor GrpE [Oscillospiraceae bacterium]